MAPPPTSMVCPSCGHKNSPVPKSMRCTSCGAGMEAPKSTRPTAGRYQQEGFSLLWFVIAVVVQAVLTAAIVVGLPMVVGKLDFEGYYGITVAVPVWFLGGFLLGLISPGKTFVEPVIASLLVAIPTVLFLKQTQTVRTLPVFMYLVIAAIGVLFSLVGTYMGERIQMGPTPKPQE